MSFAIAFSPLFFFLYQREKIVGTVLCFVSDVAAYFCDKDQKLPPPSFPLALLLFCFFPLVGLAMSNKPVLDDRILITVREYESLIKRSKQLTVHEHKVATQLKDEIKPTKSTNQIDKVNPESSNPQPSEQTGSGTFHSPHLSQDELIKQITSRVAAELKTLYQNKTILSEQTGAGANDLIADLPSPSSDVEQDISKEYNSPTTAPAGTDVVIHKSKQSSEIADQSLINILPGRFKNRGTKLLQSLANFPSTLTWSNTGTVFINQLSVPNSNIYEIFPKLFKFVKNLDAVFGLSEVINTIASLGFGSLINRQYISGLTRPYKILNQDSIFEDLKTHKYWWFLGQ